MSAELPASRPGSSLVRGIAWTGGLRWLAQVLSWASTLVLVRLLEPTDYGLVAMALPVMTWLLAIATFGVTETVTMGPALDRRQLSQLYGFMILTGVVVATALAAAAPMWVAWYGDERVGLVLIVLSVSIVAEACRAVPYGTLSRSLRFDHTAQVDLARGVGSTVIVLIGAFSGLGYWALVLGHVGSSLLSAALAARFAAIRPKLPHLAELRPVLGRARLFLVGNIAGQTYAGLDAVVAGAVLGAPALGVLQLAKTLAFLPVEKLVAVVNAVTPAVLAQSARDRGELRRLFSKLTEAILLVVSIPLAGLVVVADLLVPVLLGQRWISVVAPLRVLALAAVMAAAGGVTAQVAVVATGPRINTVVALAAVPVGGILFVVGSQAFGILGVAAAWVVLHPLIQLGLLRVALAECQMSWRSYAGLWLTPSLASLGIAVSVGLVRLATPAAFGPLAALAASILGGGVVGALVVAKSQSVLVVEARQRVTARLQQWRRARSNEPI